MFYWYKMTTLIKNSITNKENILYTTGCRKIKNVIEMISIVVNNYIIIYQYLYLFKYFTLLSYHLYPFSSILLYKIFIYPITLIKSCHTVG